MFFKKLIWFLIHLVKNLEHKPSNLKPRIHQFKTLEFDYSSTYLTRIRMRLEEVGHMTRISSGQWKVRQRL